MTRPPWDPLHLLEELKRRKVVRVAIAYGLVGGGMIQIADVIVERLNLPLGIAPAVIVLILVGFPLALVLAWAYDVTPVGVVRAEEMPTTGDAVEDARRRRRLSVSRRVGLGILSLIVVAVLITSWMLVRPMTDPEAVALAESRYADSVAVMPLDNYTGNPSLDYVGMAITEEIINHLSQLGRLKVISRHSVEALADAGYPAPQLADSLNVRHIVEGSFQLVGDRLRVTLQHIDASADRHLWSDVFITGFDDRIQAQEEVARFVIQRLSTVLPDAVEIEPVSDEYVEPGPGGEAYQLGRHWLDRRTPEGLLRAFGHFENAIANDPDYAPAHASLSSLLTVALIYRYKIGVDGWDAAARALRAAERAIELDPELGSGYAARGLAKAAFGAPVDAVAPDFERAAGLAPNAAVIPSWSARVLRMQGQLEQAMAEARRAVDLDPLAAGRHIAVALLALFLGDYEQAVAAGRRASELEPDLVLGKATMGRALLAAGDARACVDLDLGPHVVLHATCLAAAGRGEEAAAIVDSVTTAIANGSLDSGTFSEVLWFEDLAVHYAWAGQPATSVMWIERAYEESPTGIEIRVYESALFDTVRAEGELARRVRRIQDGLWSRLTSPP